MRRTIHELVMKSSLACWTFLLLHLEQLRQAWHAGSQAELTHCVAPHLWCQCLKCHGVTHLLVQNAVHCDGSLASLAITNDELTLATTNGHQ
jgi:hypothetical protein